MGEPGGKRWRLRDRYSKSTAYVAGIGAQIQDARKMAVDVLTIGCKW